MAAGEAVAAEVVPSGTGTDAEEPEVPHRPHDVHGEVVLPIPGLRVRSDLSLREVAHHLPEGVVLVPPHDPYLRQVDRTLLVPDVEQFPGHIACSSASKSEIVVPVLKDGQVVAVLDVDSDQLNDFDHDDQQALEQLMQLAATWF